MGNIGTESRSRVSCIQFNIERASVARRITPVSGSSQWGDPSRTELRPVKMLRAVGGAVVW